MTNLNELLTDWKDKRLAYKEVNRAAHEALLDGIVAEIEALKAMPVKVLKDYGVAPEFVEGDEKPKRGPGRPRKEDA